MATTTRPEDRLRAADGRAHGLNLLPLAIACALVLSGGAARADAWRINPSLTVSSVLSTNPGLQGAGLRKPDLVLAVIPQVNVQGQGAGYRLDGSVGAEAVSYLARSRADRLWPAIHLNGNARVVDRLFYIDGGFDAATGVADPLRSLAEASSNQALIVRERFSPYLERELTPDTTVTARSDNTFIQTRNGIVPGAPGNTTLSSNLLRLSSRPAPFGLTAEWSGRTTLYPQIAGSRVDYETARLNLLYAPNPELTLGVVGGTDQGTYATESVQQTLKGVTLRWTPTTRTLLDARVEDRFFGRGWDVRLSHRSPYIAISGELSKQATTYASTIAALAAGANVASLLDAALLTRIPSPADRAIAVQNLIAQRGLPTSLANPAVLYTAGAGLQNRAALSMALLGGIHTVTLSVFQQVNEDLPTTILPITASDARQRGASVNVTRRLNAETTASVSLSHVNIEGRGRNLGQDSASTGLRLTLNQNVNARTSLTGGVRFQHVSSNSILVTAADEAAVFVGVTHRF